MKNKLSTNSITKLILMEVVVVLIYFMGIGLFIALIMCLFHSPYVYIELPPDASWMDNDRVLDPIKAKFINDICVCIIAFMQVVAASFFLDNIRYWLCSLVPQAILFNLFWLFWSNYDGFSTVADTLYTSFLSNYWLSIATIFATQLIGVLINFIVRWIARKLRARKQPTPA